MTRSQKTFTSQFFLFSIFLNISMAIVVFFFCAFFIMLKPKQFGYAISISFITLIVSQFSIYYGINYLTCKPIQDIYDKRKKGLANNIESRTKLYKKLMLFPYIKCQEGFLYFIFLTLFLCIMYQVIPQIGLDRKTALISYIACMYGACAAGIGTHAYSEKLCNKFAEELVKEGVDEEIFSKKNKFGKQKKYFGLAGHIRIIIYIIFPMIYSCILDYFILRQGYFITNGIILSAQTQIKRIISANIFFFIINLGFILIYFCYLKRNNKMLSAAATELLINKNTDTEIRTSLGDQIQYNLFLLDKILKHYKMIITQATEIGKSVLRSTEDLSVISSEVSSTAIDQSADVKEILSTMEDSNALSKNIASRITEVSSGTESTKYEVKESFNLLKENTLQMEAISSSNREVIDGIKNLGEKIDNIDDIVKIIKDIADQTKIIAFNAELEAVNAGSEGKNFHIVATEIRRLANNTMESIEEISSYISTIQKASKDLIDSSEKNTEYIMEETKTSKNLEYQFSEIMNSSEETNHKAEEISNIIEQQTASFNQIVITLRQISTGIESFSVSTRIISETVNNMKEVATKLTNLKSTS